MEYSACGDAELCLLVREGSPDAFAELSSRYLRLIRAKAAQFAGPSAPEKEDLLQEGFLGPPHDRRGQKTWQHEKQAA